MPPQLSGPATRFPRARAVIRRVLPPHPGEVDLVAWQPDTDPPSPPVDGSERPAQDPVPARWFLTATERDNHQTRVRAWTRGNAVRPLVDGRTYFEALARALRDAPSGTTVLFTDWRSDPDEHLADGVSVEDLLVDAAERGLDVHGLVWRSHLELLSFSAEPNRSVARSVNAAGGSVLLDHRVHPVGSHHQKFVVLRHPSPEADVAFVGGIDLAHSRGDSSTHQGDPQTRPFSSKYGDVPAWHDVQVEVRGPAVRDVEDGFRERWQDPAAVSRLPWHVVPDLARPAVERIPAPLPEARPDPAPTGTCAVQLLRTYPHRHPRYPFAPRGERSAARGYAKALRRAKRLVYIEDQYLWSTDVAHVFAEALRREPGLHLVAVVPRHPDSDSAVAVAAARLGHSAALDLLREAGGDRVTVCDVENHGGTPVYVHAKVCIIDDVWATVGSDNVNRRSWTHDSELTLAVVDEERDTREPTDPAGLGDGARVFARDLRLRLWSEHLDLDDPAQVIDPEQAVATLRSRVDDLERWYASGKQGERPPGRLRYHHSEGPSRWQRWLTWPAYRALVDPDGRPVAMKLRGTY